MSAPLPDFLLQANLFDLLCCRRPMPGQPVPLPTFQARQQAKTAWAAFLGTVQHPPGAHPYDRYARREYPEKFKGALEGVMSLPERGWRSVREGHGSPPVEIDWHHPVALALSESRSGLDFPILYRLAQAEKGGQVATLRTLDEKEHPIDLSPLLILSALEDGRMRAWAPPPDDLLSPEAFDWAQNELTSHQACRLSFKRPVWSTPSPQAFDALLAPCVLKSLRPYPTALICALLVGLVKTGHAPTREALQRLENHLPSVDVWSGSADSQASEKQSVAALKRAMPALRALALDHAWEAAPRPSSRPRF